jgi:hypothetical protein
MDEYPSETTPYSSVVTVGDVTVYGVVSFCFVFVAVEIGGKMPGILLVVYLASLHQSA